MEAIRHAKRKYIMLTPVSIQTHHLAQLGGYGANGS
jgi:hypothetical protein